ncbi:MAG: family 10 glycosylhydrolase [Victivallaceae bacterium]
MFKYIPKAGWGCYSGDGYCTWGITDKERHSGKNSVCLVFEKFSKKSNGDMTANFGICLGQSNGYTGKKAIKVLANTVYKFSFYIKGDMPELKLNVIGWKTEEARAEDRLVLMTTKKNIVPSLVWTKYEGSFITEKNIKKIAICIKVVDSSNSGKLKPRQSVFIDDSVMEKVAECRKISSGSPAVVKVAVYDDGRRDKEYIFETLKNVPGIEVGKIKNLRPETLEQFDVLILTTVNKMNLTDRMDIDSGKNWMHALLNFVDSGKGLILGHDCAGWRLFAITQLFPMVSTGKKSVKWAQKLSVTAKEHPVLRGVPSRFNHAYFDHIALIAGKKAKVLVQDSQKNPVLVAADVSRGRVIAIGYPMGIASAGGAATRKVRKDYFAPLLPAEKKILLNSIKWCAERPRYEVPQEVTNVTLLPVVRFYNEVSRQLKMTKWKKLAFPQFDEAYIIFHRLNGQFILDTEKKLIEAIDNCKTMGFTTVNIVAFSGYSQYPSSLVEPYPVDMGQWLQLKTPINQDFDPVKIVIREARKRNIKVALTIGPFKIEQLWRQYPNLTGNEAKTLKTGCSLENAIRYKGWACPDHPTVRKMALSITEEIIKKYHPDEIWLDYIRYKDDYACFCDYSIKERGEFAKKYPNLSPDELINKFSEKSIVSFVEQWVKLCKKIQPDIKTAAYTHLDWMNKFPVDYHCQRVSRGLADGYASFESIQKKTEALCKWVKEYHPDCIPVPFVDMRDDKTGERIYTELKIVGNVLKEAKIKKIYFGLYSYNMLTSATYLKWNKQTADSYKLNLNKSSAIRRALEHRKKQGKFQE